MYDRQTEVASACVPKLVSALVPKDTEDTREQFQPFQYFESASLTALEAVPGPTRWGLSRARPALGAHRTRP